MTKTDRAFRAFARAHPGSVVSLLRLLAPELVDVDEGEIVTLSDPHLDLPPYPRETDWAATVGTERLLHVECQGYGDKTFIDRIFDDHVRLTAWHPTRQVVSCALWLRAPTGAQRARTIRRGALTLEPVTIVLKEVAAALLLSRPETACFAMAGALGDMTVDQLCARVVAELARRGANEHERMLAAMAALLTERYDPLMNAMENAAMEPIVIEDFVHYGFERGLEKGIEKGIVTGIEKGIAAAALDLIDARKLHVSDAQRARILGEHDVERLRDWHRRLVTAGSVEEALG